MSILYSNSDMVLIEEKIDDIIDNARREELKRLEPSLEEYNNVMSIILSFIKDNKRIIYGGWGWNKLITFKNNEDRIYSEDKIELPDVEFYSPEPAQDLVKICDILYKKNFNSVRGEEAQHHETYKLFVNYLPYVDISYMPKLIFHRMPIIKMDGLLISHPKFILIDILRMYNDPITSYWRVKKNLIRANKLLKHYPLDTKGNLTKIEISSGTQNVLDYVRKEIINGSELLVFGYYGFQYYMYKANDSKKEELYVPYYDVISTNLEIDVHNIHKKLIDKYGEDISVIEYHPFFQFMDYNISFLYKGKQVLNVYGGNGKCIPYFHLENKNINIVTFPYMILTLLVRHMYHLIQGNHETSKNYDYLLEQIIKGRNTYLKTHKKNILDDTPFQEFRVQCFGETMDEQRKYRISTDEKYKKKTLIKWRYNPTNGKSVDTSNYCFDNTSGNPNNGKRRILR